MLLLHCHLAADTVTELSRYLLHEFYYVFILPIYYLALVFTLIYTMSSLIYDQYTLYFNNHV